MKPNIPLDAIANPQVPIHIGGSHKTMNMPSGKVVQCSLNRRGNVVSGHQCLNPGCQSKKKKRAREQSLAPEFGRQHNEGVSKIISIVDSFRCHIILRILAIKGHSIQCSWNEEGSGLCGLLEMSGESRPGPEISRELLSANPWGAVLGKELDLFCEDPWGRIHPTVQRFQQEGLR